MMRFAVRWAVLGAVAMVGAIWLCVRAAVALDLVDYSSSWTVVALAALGATITGAVVSRHGSGWRESVVGSVLVVGFFALVGVYAHRDNSIAGPVSLLATVQLVIASAMIVAGAYAGALLGRRFAAQTASVPAILVLSCLLINGTLIVFMGTAFILGDAKVSIVPLVLLAPLVGGFAAQSLLAVRRPRVCGAGGLLLLLLFLQESGKRDLGPALFACGMFGVLGWMGAGIAARVFRARWASPAVELPSAQVR